MSLCNKVTVGGGGGGGGVKVGRAASQDVGRTLSDRLLLPYGPNSLGSNEMMKKIKEQHLWLLEESWSRKLLPSR